MPQRTFRVTQNRSCVRKPRQNITSALQLNAVATFAQKGYSIIAQAMPHRETSRLRCIPPVAGFRN